MSLYTRRSAANRYRDALRRDLDRLEAELGQQRRRELVYGPDPLDALTVEAANSEAVTTTIIEVETPGGEDADPQTIARKLNREVGRALGELYLDVRRAEDQAHDVAAYLRASTPHGEAHDELAMLALFGRPQAPHTAGDQRPRAIRRLGGHLLAMKVRPAIALGMLEAWDAAHCHPPLGPLAVERELRWVARKQTRQLRGAA